MRDLNCEINTPPLLYRGLTTREVEVLKWSAEGKTAAEVALILDLKLRTVNFHIGSAIQKIGASNKTSAVVHAALRGLFFLEAFR